MDYPIILYQHLYLSGRWELFSIRCDGSDESLHSIRDVCRLCLPASLPDLAADSLWNGGARSRHRLGGVQENYEDFPPVRQG